MLFNYPFAVETFWKILKEGLPVSLWIVLLTCLVSLPLAFLLGLVRFKKVKGATQVSTVLISFFRGTPLIILVFLLYSALPQVLALVGKERGWGIDFFNINKTAYAVFICCLFTISNQSEIFRSALAAVNAGQLEAAHAVGLSSFQAYIHVIVPQALVSAIPNLGNNIINLFKGTALLFYMGVADIMGVAKSAAGVNYCYLEAYVDVFIVYVIVCYVMQKGFELLEKKLNVYNAR